MHNTYSFSPKDPNSKRTKRYLKREAKKVEDEIVKKQANSLKKKSKENKNVEKEGEENQFNFDLWSGEKDLKINDTNEYFLRTTNRIMPNKPKNFDVKPSLLPAIELPHPGTSYNPTYEDHQDLLLKAHLVELEKLKKEEKLMRNMDAKIPKMTEEQIEKLWLKEMSTGLELVAKIDDEESAINLEHLIKPAQAEKVPFKIKKKQLEEKLKVWET
jgi:nucleolar protein 53